MTEDDATTQFGKRRFLKGVAGVAATLAGCATASQPTGTERTEPRHSTGTATATRSPTEPRTDTRTAEETPTHRDASQFTEAQLATARDVGEAGRESVFVLRREKGEGHITATGWAYDEHTILSNGHVVEGASEMECWTVDGESFTATVRDSAHGSVGETGHADVGRLHTDESLTPVQSGDSSTLDADQPLVQVGHPGLVGNWVISVGRFLRHDRFFGFLSTIPTLSGSSGSPVFDFEGRVVGMTGGQSSRGDSQGSPDGAPAVTELGAQTSFEEEVAATHTPIEAIDEFVDAG